jgi:hypothetical protein
MYLSPDITFGTLDNSQLTVQNMVGNNIFSEPLRGKRAFVENYHIIREKECISSFLLGDKICF